MTQRRAILLAALCGLLLGAAPLLVFILSWEPCLAICWPE